MPRPIPRADDDDPYAPPHLANQPDRAVIQRHPQPRDPNAPPNLIPQPQHPPAPVAEIYAAPQINHRWDYLALLMGGGMGTILVFAVTFAATILWMGGLLLVFAAPIIPWIPTLAGVGAGLVAAAAILDGDNNDSAPIAILVFLVIGGCLGYQLGVFLTGLLILLLPIVFTVFGAFSGVLIGFSLVNALRDRNQSLITVANSLSGAAGGLIFGIIWYITVNWAWIGVETNQALKIILILVGVGSSLGFLPSVGVWWIRQRFGADAPVPLSHKFVLNIVCVIVVAGVSWGAMSHCRLAHAWFDFDYLWGYWQAACRSRIYTFETLFPPRLKPLAFPPQPQPVNSEQGESAEVYSPQEISAAPTNAHATQQTPPYQPQIYEVTAIQLNVRQGPGLSHHPIYVLNSGEKVEVLEILPDADGDLERRWGRIVLPDGRTGYVSLNSDYIKPESSSPNSTPRIEGSGIGI